MIDPKLQAELRAKFNPDGSKLRNYQLYLLQMLKDFDTICNELGVKYWLSSGTLIGALPDMEDLFLGMMTSMLK